jgi:hypothetical protein
MVRLFNVDRNPAPAKITWLDPTPREVTVSSPFEEAGTMVKEPLEIGPLEIVTLRADL